MRLIQARRGGLLGDVRRAPAEVQEMAPCEEELPPWSHAWVTSRPRDTRVQGLSPVRGTLLGAGDARVNGGHTPCQGCPASRTLIWGGDIDIIHICHMYSSTPRTLTTQQTLFQGSHLLTKRHRSLTRWAQTPGETRGENGLCSTGLRRFYSLTI